MLATLAFLLVVGVGWNSHHHRQAVQDQDDNGVQIIMRLPRPGQAIDWQIVVSRPGNYEVAFTSPNGPDLLSDDRDQPLPMSFTIFADSAVSEDNALAVSFQTTPVPYGLVRVIVLRQSDEGARITQELFPLPVARPQYKELEP